MQCNRWRSIFWLPVDTLCGRFFRVRIVEIIARSVLLMIHFPLCSPLDRAEHHPMILEEEQLDIDAEVEEGILTENGNHHGHEILDAVFAEVADDPLQFSVDIAGQVSHCFRQGRRSVFTHGRGEELVLGERTTGRNHRPCDCRFRRHYCLASFLFFQSNRRKKKWFSLFIMGERSKHTSNSIESCDWSKHLFLSLTSSRHTAMSHAKSILHSDWLQNVTDGINWSEWIQQSILTSKKQSGWRQFIHRTLFCFRLISFRTCRDLLSLAFEQRLQLRISMQSTTEGWARFFGFGCRVRCTRRLLPRWRWWFDERCFWFDRTSGRWDSNSV